MHIGLHPAAQQLSQGGDQVLRVQGGEEEVLRPHPRQFRSISSFKDYQSLIDLNRHFFRCHKSYVVNLSAHQHQGAARNDPPDFPHPVLKLPAGFDVVEKHIRSGP